LIILRELALEVARTGFSDLSQNMWLININGAPDAKN
jgi:hypothetical protein